MPVESKYSDNIHTVLHNTDIAIPYKYLLIRLGLTTHDDDVISHYLPQPWLKLKQIFNFNF